MTPSARLPHGLNRTKQRRHQRTRTHFQPGTGLPERGDGDYPEFRNCRAPSTERILEVFAPVARHHLHRDGTPVQTFQPQLTSQQLQILELLGIPPSAYTQEP
ncbi:MAG: hypothetical protein WCF04_02610 [Candidatus Nanopelagicales bacterium]